MKEGDKQKFIESYDTYAESIFRYCYLRVHDRERARELMQETFTKTWEYLVAGKSIDSLKSFLYKVAHNLSVNEVVRHKSVSLDELEETVGFEPKDEERASPEEDTEISLLLSKMKELSPKDQELLSLRFMSGLAISEMSEILGEKPNTITVRVKRALEELREKIKPQ